MTQRLSDRTVRALKPPESKYRIIYDDQLAGFGIRVTKAGAKAFILNYAVHGRERRITIGKYPAWSVAAARERAGQLRQAIDLGNDPMAERHAKRAELTVNALCDKYLGDHVRGRNRDSTYRHYADLIDKHIRPELGKLKLSAVKHSDIERMHKAISQEHPIQANRAASVASQMFNVAIKWGLCRENPVKGLEKNYEPKRDRYLSGDEIRRVCKALAEYPLLDKVRVSRARALETGEKSAWRKRDKPLADRQQSCNALRLIMLTGARKGEALSAQWAHFDLEAGVWTKPRENTKQKLDHRVPLSAPALSLLSELPRTSAYVFPNKIGGHQTDLKKTWSSICDLAGIQGVRVHDLRHTYASLLASAGLSLPIIGALLGHTQTATTARYAHLLDDPLREATERVGAAYLSAETSDTSDL